MKPETKMPDTEDRSGFTDLERSLLQTQAAIEDLRKTLYQFCRKRGMAYETGSSVADVLKLAVLIQKARSE